MTLEFLEGVLIEVRLLIFADCYYVRGFANLRLASRVVESGMFGGAQVPVQVGLGTPSSATWKLGSRAGMFVRRPRQLTGRVRGLL